MKQLNRIHAWPWSFAEFAGLVALALCGACAHPTAKAAVGLERPDYVKFNETEAVRFNQTAKKRQLVYTRLAEYLVDRFDLAERPGIGIDIGGGPGDLVIELASRTKQFYWINTDINTWYARPFAEETLKRGLSHRTGFVFADVCMLPFKDQYADIMISRGAYQFWGSLEEGVSDLHRVLKHGGWAFIGRGLPSTMPEREVRDLRNKRLVGGPPYDPDKDAETFQAIMRKLNVKEYEVIRHKSQNSTVGYGVWLCFRRD